MSRERKRKRQQFAIITNDELHEAYLKRQALKAILELYDGFSDDEERNLSRDLKDCTIDITEDEYHLHGSADCFPLGRFRPNSNYYHLRVLAEFFNIKDYICKCTHLNEKQKRDVGRYD